jgi:predicted NUDIX family phosphoesterase
MTDQNQSNDNATDADIAAELAPTTTLNEAVVSVTEVGAPSVASATEEDAAGLDGVLIANDGDDRKPLRGETPAIYHIDEAPFQTQLNSADVADSADDTEFVLAKVTLIDVVDEAPSIQDTALNQLVLEREVDTPVVSKDDEMVLTVSRDDFLNKSPKEWTSYAMYRRGDVDKGVPNPEIKQLIPYTILLANRNGQASFLTYERGGKSTETKLADKLSVGLGGHVNQFADDYDSLVSVFTKNIVVEMKEEIGIDFDPVQIRSIVESGLAESEENLYCTETAEPVDALHGAFFNIIILGGEHPETFTNEAGHIENVKWMTLAELNRPENVSRLETWSAVAIAKILRSHMQQETEAAPEVEEAQEAPSFRLKAGREEVLVTADDYVEAIRTLIPDCTEFGQRVAAQDIPLSRAIQSLYVDGLSHAVQEFNIYPSEISNEEWTIVEFYHDFIIYVPTYIDDALEFKRGGLMA